MPAVSSRRAYRECIHAPPIRWHPNTAPESRFERVRDVVGREHGDFTRLGQTGCAHHGDVHPGDRQYARAAIRCRRHAADAVRITLAHTNAGEIRQKLSQMRAQQQPAPPGPPPPCGMAKVLCKFRCDTSPPNCPWRAQADHRVHVRAIDVDLTAVLMHDVADFGYAGFTHRAWTDR